MKSHYTLVLSATVVLFAAACADAPTGPATVGTVPQPLPLNAIQQRMVLQALPLGIDEDFIEAAMQIPGYGGHSVRKGRLIVYLQDMTHAGNARRVLSSMFDIGAGSPLLFEFRKGDYDFIELTRWRHRLDSIWRIKGVVLLDTDEARNRLAIGVDERLNPSVGEQVRAEVARLNIPTSAVMVEPASLCVYCVDDGGGGGGGGGGGDSGDGSTQSTTLESYNHVLRGGLAIQWKTTSGEVQPGACTLGANAVDSRGNSYFITASHCSGRMASLDPNGLVWYQGGTSVAGNQIGTEVEDPGTYIGAHPRGDKACPPDIQLGCRWTDMTVIAYGGTGRQIGKGRIARPRYANTTFDPISIDPSKPDFLVVGANIGRLTGDRQTYLHKVGRKTGWTTGVNTDHCVDYSLIAASTGGKTLLLLCQTGSDVRIEGGDSGGPVFKALYQQTVDEPVSLLGTMVAGGTRNGAPYSLFSPMLNRFSEVYAPLLTDLNFAHQ